MAAKIPVKIEYKTPLELELERGFDEEVKSEILSWLKSSSEPWPVDKYSDAIYKKVHYLYNTYYGKDEGLHFGKSDKQNRQHHVWRPVLAEPSGAEADFSEAANSVEKVNFAQPEEPEQPTSSTTEHKNGIFLSIEPFGGEAALPPLVYATCISVDRSPAAGDGQIVVFGGVTINKECDNYKLKLSHEIPQQLLGKVLSNPLWESSSILYSYCPDTSLVKKPLITGDIPPALCCSSVARLNNRYVVLYGGFEVCDTVSQSSITRELVVSNGFWVLDCWTYHFKELSLVAHPTAKSLYPVTVGRYGHSMVAQTPAPGTFSVLVYGGFSGSHVPLDDLWRVDIIFTSKVRTIEFGPQALAFPLQFHGIGARGFHSAIFTEYGMVVYGGTSSTQGKDDIWRYSTKWQQVGRSSPIYSHSLVQLNKEIYVVGGLTRAQPIRAFNAKMEEQAPCDIKRESWGANNTVFGQAMVGAGGVEFGGRLIIIGGYVSDSGSGFIQRVVSVEVSGC